MLKGKKTVDILLGCNFYMLCHHAREDCAGEGGKHTINYRTFLHEQIETMVMLYC